MNFYIAGAAITVIATILFIFKNSNEMNKNPSVIGIISKIELVEIQNKAVNKTSRYQTRISLNIIEAYNANGESISISDFDYPQFAGDSSLIDEYKVNQKVKIICTSKTGRHIESIKKLD